MSTRSLLGFGTNLLAILLGLAISAHAGPPLICHVIEIENARSLPWIDWNTKHSAGYDTKNLTRDSLAILNWNTPVLVRMETLRRATLYARVDQRAAKELLTRLFAREASSQADRHAEALAWFDLGYLASAYKQWIPQDTPNPAIGVDGYGWVRKAIALDDDPEMEFAAALMTLSVAKTDHLDHVMKALAGAKNDPLLARNLTLISRYDDLTAADHRAARGVNK